MRIKEKTLKAIEVLSSAYIKQYKSTIYAEPAPLYLLFYLSGNRSKVVVGIKRIHCTNGCSYFPTINPKNVYDAVQRMPSTIQPYGLLLFSLIPGAVDDDRIKQLPIDCIFLQVHGKDMRCIRRTKDGYNDEQLICVH